MGWEREIEELRTRERLAREMGGKEKIERQRSGGKLTVRERIEQLLDPGSFHEIGAIAGKARYGEDGRRLELAPRTSLWVAGGSTAGRSWSEAMTSPYAAVPRMPPSAASRCTRSRWRMSCESPSYAWSTARAGAAVRTLNRRAHVRARRSRDGSWVINLETVPVVCLALGPSPASARAAGYEPLLGHGARHSQIFIAGPPLCGGKWWNREQGGTGGSETQPLRDGGVVVESEAEALPARADFSRTFRRASRLPPRGRVTDDAARRDEWLIGAIPSDRRKATTCDAFEFGARSRFVL